MWSSAATFAAWTLGIVAAAAAVLAGGLYAFLRFRWWKSRVNVPCLPPVFPLGSAARFTQLAEAGATRREFNLFRHIDRIFRDPHEWLVGHTGPDRPRAFQLFFGPRSVVVFRTRADIRALLHNKDIGGRARTPIGDMLFEQKGIVFISDMPRWHTHRAAALRGLLRPSFLRSLFAASMVPIARDYIAYTRASATAAPYDVADVSTLTLDVIGEAALSLALNSFPRPGQDSDADAEHIAALDDFRHGVHGLLRGLAVLGSKPKFMYPFYAEERDAALAAKATVRATMESIIEQRKGERAAGTRSAAVPDFLDMMLDAAVGDNARFFTHDDIAFVLQDVMIAGHETSSHTVAWALFFLAQDPALQDRIAAEVVAAWGPDADPDYATMDSLDLVHAVVLETLRIMPVVPSNFRRSLADTEVNGIRIPADTIVVSAFYTLGRDEEEYDNATVFNPDRWLVDAASRPSLPFSFGAGMRSCIGERMAMIEVKLILGLFIRAFSFTLATPAADVDAFQTVTMRPHPHLHLHLSER